MVSQSTDLIFEPVSLPCGREIPNRLVKVSLYEHSAALLGGPPNQSHYSLYSQWSKGHWGMICTGNFQVCKHHLSTGRDVIIPENITKSTLAPFKLLANAIHGSPQDGPLGDTRPLAILQLAHAGRQSNTMLGGRLPWTPSLAPSAIRLGGEGSIVEGFWTRLLYKFIFADPKEMTLEDIERVIDQFVHGAKVAAESGFDGIQLHASHGYLLAQFISVKHNKRTDDYSAETAPLHFLNRVVTSIRQVVPHDFIVGVKLNGADYLDSELADKRKADANRAQEDRALEHVKNIASWRTVDFIEVSGGDYENPEFMSKKPSRQAFFSSFSRQAMKALPPADPEKGPPPLILLTGGLRHESTLTSVLTENHAHLLGVGRLSVLVPDLPIQLKTKGSNFEPPPIPGFTGSTLDQIASFMFNITHISFPKLVNAGLECSWYFMGMKKMATGKRLSHGGTEALIRMWFWVAPGSGETPRSSLSGLSALLLAPILFFVLYSTI